MAPSRITHPDPTVPENLRDLQAAVRRTGAELGIAFDGDADRIVPWMSTADRFRRSAAGDLCRDACATVREGTPVIFDVKCSQVLPEALERAGANQ
jgi:phosphomannomutase